MKKKTDLAPFLYESCEELSKKFKELKSPYDVAQLLQVPYKYLVYYIYRIPHDFRYTKFHGEHLSDAISRNTQAKARLR